ncbi:MAG: outer membrane protein assembly factor BamD [Burkholderiales bacterium]|jgi:tol-pal system protein YbgF|nr:outer membrane protein assembly factor BamD [Burkholderiales bacterium]
MTFIEIRSNTRTLIARLALALASTALVASPAHALFEDDELRKVFNEFRERVKTQNQQTLDKLNEMTVRLEKLEAGSRGHLLLNQELEAQRKEIASLRGALELATNDLATTQRRLKDYFNDVDNRIRKVEPKQVEIDGRLVTVGQDESASYDAAFEAYKSGDFNNAAQQLDDFNRRFPNSGYGVLSMYYAGVAHFGKKDFKAAIAAHTKFLEKYPASPRTPDAMLNLADNHLSLKEVKAAKKVLETLLEKFPDSAVADSAKKRLALLKN